MTRRAIRRNTWSEMRRYWETHDDLRSNVDWSSDPDGLDNVCHPGAPQWLNAYYARGQRDIYEALLSLAPDGPGRRALEVGCGAGRWCRLLYERGYEVTGIDLQNSLISRNRERYPAIAFDRSSLQEYEPDSRFDLVSSVTVLQHVPFSEQEHAIERMRSTVIEGGHAVVLENIRDQAPHVFSRSIADWADLFRQQAFQVVALRRYDYNPMLRAIGVARRLARRALPGSIEASSHGPEGHEIARWRASESGPASRALLRAMRAAVSIDSRIEPRLVNRNTRLPTVHAGFLLGAV